MFKLRHNFFKLKNSANAVKLYRNQSTDLKDVPKNESMQNNVNEMEKLAQAAAAHDLPVEMENPYLRERKVCLLCKYNIKLDYKNAKLLSQFVSPFTGQLYTQNITRLCNKQHKFLEREINRSITAGFMASMAKSVEFLKDPQIVDPNKPIKPHKF